MKTACLVSLAFVLITTGCTKDSGTSHPPQGGQNNPGPQASSVVVDISANESHVCAILSGRVLCWDQSAYDRPVFADPPSDLKNPTRVSAGYVSCAAIEDGIRCWGLTDDGNGTLNPPSKAKRISEIAVTIGDGCYIQQGRLDCWGSLKFPLNYPSLTSTTSLSRYSVHYCAIAEGSIACWGGSADDTVVSSAPKSLKNPREVSVGERHACAISDDGVFCWGKNEHRQLEVPKQLLNPRGLSAGKNHTCVIVDDGVKCWGRNSMGVRYPPIEIRNPSKLASGAEYTCASTGDSVQCWGDMKAHKIPSELTKNLPSPATNPIPFYCYNGEKDAEDAVVARLMAAGIRSCKVLAIDRVSETRPKVEAYQIQLNCSTGAASARVYLKKSDSSGMCGIINVEL